MDGDDSKGKCRDSCSQPPPGCCVPAPKSIEGCCRRHPRWSLCWCWLWCCWFLWCCFCCLRRKQRNRSNGSKADVDEESQQFISCENDAQMFSDPGERYSLPDEQEMDIPSAGPVGSRPDSDQIALHGQTSYTNENEIQKSGSVAKSNGFGAQTNADSPKHVVEGSSKDSLDIDDHLWRYIEKYRKEDLKKCLGNRIKTTYSRATKPYHLDIESTDGRSVMDESEKIAALVQEMFDHIVCDTITVAEGSTSVKKIVDEITSTVLCYFDDGKWYIVGPARELDTVKKRVLASLGNLSKPGPDFKDAAAATIPPGSLVVKTPAGGITVVVYRGDLCKLTVDAIVNPANSKLKHGSGVAKAISDAAGQQFVDECGKLMNGQKKLEVSDVVHTSAGKLSSIRYVIHTVGPQEKEYRGKEDDLRAALVATFFNCLQYANDTLRDVRSVAIPAISAGKFGVPRTLVAESAIEALVKFDKNIGAGASLRINSVHFVNIDDESTTEFRNAFHQWSLRQQSTGTNSVSSVPAGDGNRDQKLQLELTDSGIYSLEADADRDRLLREPDSSAAMHSLLFVDDQQKSSQRRSTRQLKNPLAWQEPSINPATLSLPYLDDQRDPLAGESSRPYSSLDSQVARMVPARPEPKGNRQPAGSMTENILSDCPLPGYELYQTIQIEYRIPDGIQNDSHPNPGQPYSGTNRFAYLPDNDEGREVCRLLRQAFDAGLVLTVGRSESSGKDNVVILSSDVPHKTKRDGPNGYPDPAYLASVKAKLLVLLEKGIRKADMTAPPSSASSSDPTLKFTTPCGIAVNVFRGNLLAEQTAAIVNPCNTFLSHGGGAARAIADAAGQELIDECTRIIDIKGLMKVTDVVYTTAGKMNPPIRYVLHAAGPPAADFPDKTVLRRTVKDTFYNCLLQANALQLASLSIPAISSGIFGVPKPMVADAAYDALMEFDGEFSAGKPPHLRQVNYANLDLETTQVFVTTFQARQNVAGPGRVDRSTPSALGYQWQASGLADAGGMAVDDVASARKSKVESKDADDDDVDDEGDTVDGLFIGTRIKKLSSSSSADKPKDDDCVICMCPMSNPKKLACGHTFCADCIDQSFAKCQPKCPSCGRMFGVMKGNQPPGTMLVHTTPGSLAGFPACNTIEIEYDIPSGTQNDIHPNPGQPYVGTARCAYLPNNAEGNEVCRLLRRAFDAGLIFTVGRSITTGVDNCVIWNDIHHKTSHTGQFGYPDPTYLDRIKDELAAKGIVAE